mmetsp:Transcript_6486/g.9975  ORF Transcript_6486/g.9975 Transcript_6486/m.9975 type:complete len:672 (-) Transcript_6486:87-2102(-)
MKTLRERIASIERVWNRTISDLSLASTDNSAQSSSSNLDLEKIFKIDSTSSDESWLESSLKKKTEFTKHLWSTVLKGMQDSELKKQLSQVQKAQSSHVEEREKLQGKIATLSAILAKKASTLANTKLQLDLKIKQCIRLKEDVIRLEKDFQAAKENASLAATSSVVGDTKGDTKIAAEVTADPHALDLVKDYSKKIDDLNKEIVELKETVRNERISKRQIGDDIVRQTPAYSELETHLHFLKQQWQYMKTMLDNRVKQCELLERKLGHERQRFAEFSKGLEGRMDSRLRQLIDIRIEREKLEASSRKEQLKRLETEVESLQKKNREGRAREEKQKQEMAKLDEFKKATAKNITIRALLVKNKQLTKTLEGFKSLSSEKKTLSELAASEKKLKEENEKLKEDLETCKDKDKKELLESLEEQNETTESLIAELDELNIFVTNKEEENKGMQKQLDQMEKTRADMLKKQLQLKEKLQNTMIEIKALRKKESTSEMCLSEKNSMVEHLESCVAAYKKEMGDCRGRIKSMQNMLEATSRETKEASTNAQKLKAAHEQSTASLANLSKELKETQMAKQNLEKEKIELVSRLKKYKSKSSSNGTEDSGLVFELRSQLGEMQQKLNCPLCSEENREVIIARCFHTFCRKCIEKCYKGRNRKCPQCKLTFSINDVKTLWL